MTVKGLGKQIRHYRLKKNWRQEELAEAAGLSTSYIGMLERDEKSPKLDTFVHLANILEASADELLSDSLENGYQIKLSKYTEQISSLSAADQKRIFDVLDTLLKNS